MCKTFPTSVLSTIILLWEIRGKVLFYMDLDCFSRFFYYGNSDFSYSVIITRWNKLKNRLKKKYEEHTIFKRDS